MGGQPDNRTQDELLHALLNEGSPDEQRHILNRLMAIGEAESLDAIIAYLRDGHQKTRQAAFDALIVLATKYVPNDRYSLAEAIIPFLTSDEWRERLAASRILSTHPNELAISPLYELVHKAQQKVYEERHSRFSSKRLVAERTLWESVLALANCGRMSVLPDIIQMIDDPYLRPIATRAIGVIGSETQRARLEELAEDKDVRVRDAAQWSLALMDERAAQFQIPPHEQPTPPPNRLSNITWAHRQLVASDDTLTQFLIVRFAVEHLLLDTFLSQGRTPLPCVIRLYEQDGEQDKQIIDQWAYQWRGPELHPLSEEEAAECKSHIDIIMPSLLMFDGEGRVEVNYDFHGHLSEGWAYHIEYKHHSWIFSRGRRLWSGD